MPSSIFDGLQHVALPYKLHKLLHRQRDNVLHSVTEINRDQHITAHIHLRVQAALQAMSSGKKACL